ncbi:hypothetical protein PYW07_015410 [Mythimna separata]|uniref:Uncharacterized protein n=1 Tax=Mythimna separata TaxID=271217 RepID=A0AAD8DYY0_MYTSE|nr:hypothetical protein PYW07_015410 [Mythimna separata]
MDISFNESFPLKTRIKTEKLDDSTEKVQLTNNTKMPDSKPVVKKFHINLQKPPKSYKNMVFQSLSVGIIILVSIFALHIYSLKCFDDFNIEELRNVFSNKLFGQTEAVNNIMQALELEERSKLLLFSGGTGVGKSFASSILLDAAGPCSNVYHYTMPSFTNTFSTDFMYGLTMCKKSLIIVDDLTVDDMHIKAQIKEVTEKCENYGKDIIVILIYNCYESTKDFIKNCDESFHKSLLKNFADIKAVKKLVEFKPLTITHLKECIKQELGGRILNDKELEDILKNFNVSVDGCKGVHSKMKYLNIV